MVIVMPSVLHQDLRLLDILDNLSQPAGPPRTQDLVARLSNLCLDQGMTPDAGKIQQAVALYQRQQRIDRQSVNARSHLPASSGAQGKAEALPARLEGGRVEKPVKASPQNLRRAATPLHRQRAPFRLWQRPVNQEEWQEALRFCVERGEHYQKLRKTTLWGLGVLSASLVGLFFWAFLSVSNILGLSFLGAVYASLALIAWAEQRIRPAAKAAPERYAALMPAQDGEVASISDLEGLTEATPNLKRLARWSRSPQAKAALQLLRRTAVPITELDAAMLDRLVEQDRQQRTQRAWNAGLAQLGS